jgi:hypothetical protein
LTVWVDMELSSCVPSELKGKVMLVCKETERTV